MKEENIGGPRISIDSISRERYVAFEQTLRSLDTMFPGVRFACNLYGSLIQGKQLTSGPNGNALTTDVDAKVRFDSDDVMRILTNEAPHPLKDLLGDSTGHTVTTGDMKRCSEVIARVVKSKLIEFSPQLGTRDELTKHVLVRPISHDIHSPAFVGTDFIQGFVTAYAGGIDVDNRLRPYMQTYLVNLMARGQYSAESEWRRIAENVAFHQRSIMKSTSPYKFFPQTLQDALEYFGVPT